MMHHQGSQLHETKSKKKKTKINAVFISCAHCSKVAGGGDDARQVLSNSSCIASLNKKKQKQQHILCAMCIVLFQHVRTSAAAPPVRSMVAAGAVATGRLVTLQQYLMPRFYFQFAKKNLAER